MLAVLMQKIKHSTWEEDKIVIHKKGQETRRNYGKRHCQLPGIGQCHT